MGPSERSEAVGVPARDPAVNRVGAIYETSQSNCDVASVEYDISSSSDDTSVELDDPYRRISVLIAAYEQDAS